MTPLHGSRGWGSRGELKGQLGWEEVVDSQGISQCTSLGCKAALFSLLRKELEHETFLRDPVASYLHVCAGAPRWFGASAHLISQIGPCLLRPVY